MDKRITYRIKHIGISNPNADEAMNLANEISFVFDIPDVDDKGDNIFVGECFEVLKHDRIGIHGHIALQTEDVEKAMDDLAQRGITFDRETIRRDEQGRIVFIFLEQQFGGFAIHLVEGS